MNTTTTAEFILHQFPAWILRASWQGAALALVVLMVQRSLGKRLPARWRNALWLLVFARLLLPALPQARVSVYNLLPAQVEAISSEPMPRAARGYEMRGTEPAGVADAAGERAPMEAAVVNPAVEPRARPIQLPDWPYIWIAGALISACWSMARHLGMRRRLKRLGADVPESLCSQFATVKAELGVRHARLRVSEAVTTPCVTGLWRASVILPVNLEKQLEAGDMRMVFLHELAHVKRGDLWMAWLAWVAGALHWFNPAVRLILAFARKDREMACDEWVLRIIPDAKAYGLALVRFLEFGHGPASPGTIGIIEGKSALIQRVKRIAAYHRPTVIGSVAGFVLLATIGTLMLTGASAEKKNDAPVSLTLPLPP